MFLVHDLVLLFILGDTREKWHDYIHKKYEVDDKKAYAPGLPLILEHDVGGDHCANHEQNSRYEQIPVKLDVIFLRNHVIIYNCFLLDYPTSCGAKTHVIYPLNIAAYWEHGS